MMRRAAMVILFVSCVSFAHSDVASGQPNPPPLPSSIAAIGDSISQAKNVCCWYGDHSVNSWSTGTAWWDGVHSHYERVRALSPHVTARNWSVSGSRMDDAPGQAQQAVTQGADYVTIMLGANDLCTSSAETMTSIEAFRADFRQTLETLDGQLPTTATVFVASIPDVYQLWSIFHTDWFAQLVWDVGRVCPSLLSSGRTDAQRQLVRDRNIAFNGVLQEECAAFVRCHFDDHAVFDFRFEKKHVSRLDYFHPSLSGAAALADVTWAQTPWRP